MNGIPLAITTDDLQPHSSLSLSTPLWIGLGIAIILLAAIILACIVLSRRRPQRTQHPTSGTHSAHNAKKHWLSQIDAIVQSYNNHEISENEAYAQLAALVRTFASQQSGHSFDTSTLMDLQRRPDSGHAANWDSLRLTIAALYPPEFADASADVNAQEANVQTASEWVSNFVERWR